MSRATDGYHTVNGDTTGGEGGPTVIVTTAADFSNYVNQPGSYIVQVQGILVDWQRHGEIQQEHSWSRNQRHLGRRSYPERRQQCRHPERFHYQSGLVPGDGDGITIKNSSHHIWVDHCTFYDCEDGELDITHASDFVTVSWCKFFYTFDSGHNFVNLIGADDADTGDMGKLHVTFHHNWWSTLSRERMPRVRFGRVHSYNNYFNAPGNNYCVRAALESEVLIEAGYFENVKTPWEIFAPSGTPGRVRAVSNAFVNVTGPNDLGTNTVFKPPYSYALDDVADIPNIVTNDAGAGKLDFGGTPFTDWQLQYFGCTDCPQSDAAADADGDGQNNIAEFLAGTDPTNSASALRIISVARQANDVSIRWKTTGGKTNQVQAATALRVTPPTSPTSAVRSSSPAVATKPPITLIPAARPTCHHDSTGCGWLHRHVSGQPHATTCQARSSKLNAASCWCWAGTITGCSAALRHTRRSMAGISCPA